MVTFGFPSCGKRINSQGNSFGFKLKLHSIHLRFRQYNFFKLGSYQIPPSLTHRKPESAERVKMLLDIGVLLLLHEKNWQQAKMMIREELAAGENDDKAIT